MYDVDMEAFLPRWKFWPLYLLAFICCGAAHAFFGPIGLVLTAFVFLPIALGYQALEADKKMNAELKAMRDEFLLPPLQPPAEVQEFRLSVGPARTNPATSTSALLNGSIDPDQYSVELRASMPKEAGVFCVICLCCLFAFSLPAISTRDHVMVIAARIMFGLSILITGWRVFHPYRLVLDEEGFTLRGGFEVHPKKVRWLDVERFIVSERGRAKLLAYRPKTDANPRFARFEGDRKDVALYGFWPQSPKGMAEELNQYLIGNRPRRQV